MPCTCSLITASIAWANASSASTCTEMPGAPVVPLPRFMAKTVANIRRPGHPQRQLSTTTAPAAKSGEVGDEASADGDRHGEISGETNSPAPKTAAKATTDDAIEPP